MTWSTSCGPNVQTASSFVLRPLGTRSGQLIRSNSILHSISQMLYKLSFPPHPYFHIGFASPSINSQHRAPNDAGEVRKPQPMPAVPELALQLRRSVSGTRVLRVLSGLGSHCRVEMVRSIAVMTCSKNDVGCAMLLPICTVSTGVTT